MPEAPRTQARSLAAQFTAFQLAEKLIAKTTHAKTYHARAQRAEAALQSIARGQWTADGARQVARRALDGEVARWTRLETKGALIWSLGTKGCLSQPNGMQTRNASRRSCASRT